MSRVSATIKRGLTKTDYQCLGTGTRDELRTMCPSLKRDVPQIGTDGQWPYDRVPDETIKYLLGQYFEILTYK